MISEDEPIMNTKIWVGTIIILMLTNTEVEGEVLTTGTGPTIIAENRYEEAEVKEDTREKKF